MPLYRPFFSIFRSLFRTWLTGFIYLLAALGYMFYGLLWTMRLFQKRLLLASTMFLLALAGATLFHFLYDFSNEGAPVTIVVKPGTPLGTIADTLAKRHVVRSRKGLLLWMKLTGKDRSIEAGKFTFRQFQGIVPTAEGLQDATPIERQVTIPEGLTIYQTASVYDSVLGIDTTAFARACRDSSILSSLGNPPSGTVEGYLFPNTYRFPEAVTASEVVQRMVEEFLEEYAQLKPEPSIVNSYNRHEIVTMASIVEREATVAHERTRIAGVFYNRLRIGYPLGADPTVRYALQKFKGPLRVSELKNPSPYNTRLHKGLPPGPICSPGRGALQASVAPMQTKELYFVAKWDGSGEHDFSRTNVEHERKKLEIRHQNRLRLERLKANRAK